VKSSAAIKECCCAIAVLRLKRGVTDSKTQWLCTSGSLSIVLFIVNMFSKLCALVTILSSIISR
jgi:hypothetical protein